MSVHLAIFPLMKLQLIHWFSTSFLYVDSICSYFLSLCMTLDTSIYHDFISKYLFLIHSLCTFLSPFNSLIFYFNLQISSLWCFGTLALYFFRCFQIVLEYPLCLQFVLYNHRIISFLFRYELFNQQRDIFCLILFVIPVPFTVIGFIFFNLLIVSANSW